MIEKLFSRPKFRSDKTIFKDSSKFNFMKTVRN